MPTDLYCYSCRALGCVCSGHEDGHRTREAKLFRAPAVHLHQQIKWVPEVGTLNFFLVHNLNSATVYLQFFKETLLRNCISKCNFSAFCNIAFFECDVGCLRLRQWVFVILRELVFTFAEFRGILWNPRVQSSV